MSEGVVAVEMISNSRFMEYTMLWIHGNRFGEANEATDDFTIVGFKQFGVWLHREECPVAVLFAKVWAAPSIAVADVSADCWSFTPAGAHKMGNEVPIIVHQNLLRQLDLLLEAPC